MKVSGTMGRIACRLKKHLEGISEGEMLGNSAKSLIEESISPLYEEFQRAPRFFSDPVFSSDASSDDVHIFHMIVESLCAKGAFESAKTLLKEVEECMPIEKETQVVNVYKIYNPWTEAFSLPTTRSLVRKPSLIEDWKKIRDMSEKSIFAFKNSTAHQHTPFNVLYRPVKAYFLLHREVLSIPCVEREIEKIISLVRSKFFFQQSFLMYTVGKKSISFGVHSKEYREILSLLSLLVSSLRLSDVERSAKKREVKNIPSFQEISLDVLYLVGKQMEEININPYEKSSELVESAVPSVLSFHSSFFCPVLRSECSIDNPPSLLTCGHVISTRAVEKIASFRGAFFKCPYCPKEVHIRDIIRLKLPV